MVAPLPHSRGHRFPFSMTSILIAVMLVIALVGSAGSARADLLVPTWAEHSTGVVAAQVVPSPEQNLDPQQKTWCSLGEFARLHRSPVVHPEDIHSLQMAVLVLVMAPPMDIPQRIVRQNNPTPPPTIFSFSPVVPPPPFPPPATNSTPFITTFNTPPNENSPEPSSLVLAIFGSSALGFMACRRLRKPKKSAANTEEDGNPSALTDS